MDKHQAFLRLAQSVGYSKAYESVYGPKPDAKTFVRSLDALGFGSTSIAPLMKAFYGYGSESTVERYIRPERYEGVNRHKATQIELMHNTTNKLYFSGLTKETARSIIKTMFDKRATRHFGSGWPTN